MRVGRAAGSSRLFQTTKSNTAQLPAETSDPERSPQGGKQLDSEQPNGSRTTQHAAKTDKNKESAEESRHVPSFFHSGMNEPLYEK